MFFYFSLFSLFSGVQETRTGSAFGQATVPQWLYDLNCLGIETSLKDCSQTQALDAVCDHEEDMGIVCIGTWLLWQNKLCLWK